MSKKLTVEDFVKRAKEVHGSKYDYSQVDYVDIKTRVNIICPIHGEFNQTPDSHIHNHECPECGIINRRKSVMISKSNCVKNFFDIHGSLYDYSLVEYVHSKQKVKIICKKHGMFEQTPHKHTLGDGCPKCKSSRGEIKIENWLVNNQINFVTQKRFSDCKNKKPLPFDFYLPEHNTCIEFDGIQHFKISRRSKDESKNVNIFELTQLHDKMKDEYC
jgi:hypothetical protein